jgi:hypothetical protein
MSRPQVCECPSGGIYFSARRGGIPPAGPGRRAAPRSAGSPRPALLAVERRVVDVAGLPIGLAGEAQDRGVVDEAIGDGDGLGGRRQELAPLLERQIRHDHGGADPVPGADDPKELVGGVAAELGEAGVIEDQERGLRDAAEDLRVGAVSTSRPC